MYCDFYQLHERPFNVTSDPKFLYLNACYREALASLHYGITQRKGFITLIGEAGTGKTTLLKKLLDDLDESTRTVFIFNTNVCFDEILEYIFHEFDLPVHNGKRLYMLQRLNNFLLDELRNGRNVALLIDEAQDLDFSVMEDLRLLSNLETAKEKILQIVLSGQPELGQKLGNPGLRQLRQRVAINSRLQPLSRDELSEYIQARLSAAGAADAKLFSRDAESRIYEISTGIPRLVNVVCDNALVIGYALGKKRIGADIIGEAAADLFSADREPASASTDHEAPVSSPPARAGAWGASQIGMVGIVVLAILIGLLSVGRSLLGGGETATLDRPTVTRRTLDVIPPASRAEPAVAARRPEARTVEEVVPQAAAELFPVERAAPPAAVRLDSRPEPLSPRQPSADKAGAADQPTSNAIGKAPERRSGRSGAVAGEPVASRPAHSAAAAEVELARVALQSAGSEPGRGAGASEDEPELWQETEQDSPQPRRIPAVREPSGPTAAAIENELALATTSGLSVNSSSGKWSETAAPSADEPFSIAISREQYLTQPGDSMSAIAIRKYGIASHTMLDLLKMANPSIRNIDLIAAGQKLHLPALEDGLPLLRDRDRGFALLLFSSPHQRRANEMEALLRQRGFHAEVRRTDFGGGRIVYRLLVPRFDDRESAIQTGKHLQRLFREDERLAAAAR